MSDVTFLEVSVGSPEHRDAVRLRDAVLRAPLGLTLSAEELAADADCRHFVGMMEAEVIATLLLTPLDAETVKMRQVAVRPDRQGGGSGAALVRFAEAAARQAGFREMLAHARETAVPFYQRLGYVAAADTFIETTIPHRVVRKRLR